MSGKGQISGRCGHKKGCYDNPDKHDPINYRPISLTCICCKLLEHIISSNIMSHLDTNNILYDLQHGFRPARSCETQLVSFLQNLTQSNNQNIQTDVIIMDFAKAFDKVSHRHLLYKLNYYGIQCNALHWISDFLSHRTRQLSWRGKHQTRYQSPQEYHRALFWVPFFFLYT